jgi:Cft2 family RNA processing exonuclease|tara:strand:- start:48 stop:206 length:159 start_codon:yes stop_codon:yes gene_type:complete
MGFYSTKCIEVIYLIRQYIKMLKVPIVVEEDIEIKSLDYVKEKLKYIRKTIH